MFSRHLRPRVEAALEDTPVVLITGPRQVGKSTLVEAIARDRGYRLYSFDDADVLASASRDAKGFINRQTGPVVLDEIQRVPALLPAIKRSVDRNRTPGRFLLTGSANVLALPRVSESLAGRVELLTLWPLSQTELEGTSENFVDRVFAPRLVPGAGGETQRADLIARVIRGGYPEAVSRAAERRRAAWFQSYVTTMIERDVRDLAHIQGRLEMPRLLRLVAARSANLLNRSALASEAGLPQTTLARYLSLLELTYLITAVPAWSGSRTTRLTKSPKVMMVDSGLAGHLLHADSRLLADHAMLGALLENFVTMELRKLVDWSELAVQVQHFRTAKGTEVDVVLEAADGRLVGIEVKAASTVHNEDFRGLRRLAALAKGRLVRGVVLYGGDELLPFGDGMVALPLRTLWAWRVK